MMARSSTAPAIGRIQKRKTDFSLASAAAPYRWASNGPCRSRIAGYSMSPAMRRASHISSRDDERSTTSNSPSASRILNPDLIFVSVATSVSTVARHRIGGTRRMRART